MPRLHGTGRIWDRSEIRPFSPVYTRIRPVKCHPDTPDEIRQRDAIFRFSLTDNFDSSLNFPNI
jgi:hypothetical protein